MRRTALQNYRCPKCFQPLSLEIISENEGSIEKGALISPAGYRYPIESGIPDFTAPFTLETGDAYARNMYEETADVYDEYLPLTFMTFNQKEEEVRDYLASLLEIKPGNKVLETGCGTGRDSEYILKKLNNEGNLYLQDISPSILNKCKEKFKDSPIVEFSIANGSELPFPNQYFDASFHFGGLNTFSDIKKALQEMVRVTKIGGKIVVGDENMPVWLRETEFGKILMNSNPHYRYPLPLEHMPIEAREVNLRWIIGGVFYVIDFKVGIGSPTANFDFEIPGMRGGTHRTRYYGNLEGVKPETKKLAQEACKKLNKSLHQWLEETIQEEAKKILKK